MDAAAFFLVGHCANAFNGVEMLTRTGGAVKVMVVAAFGRTKLVPVRLMLFGIVVCAYIVVVVVVKARLIIDAVVGLEIAKLIAVYHWR